VKRRLKYAAAIVLLCVVLFFAYITSLHLFIDPFFARREAIRLLSAASTSQQLQEAVGSLGTFYTFPDSSWVAIRYRDSHSGGIWSVAVARDSGGDWYQSSEHFCGAFSIVRHLQKLSAALGEPPEPPSDERGKWIQQLGASPDLQSARQHITSRYFTQLR
jgi:hypothetical protein